MHSLSTLSTPSWHPLPAGVPAGEARMVDQLFYFVLLLGAFLYWEFHAFSPSGNTIISKLTSIYC